MNSYVAYISAIHVDKYNWLGKLSERLNYHVISRYYISKLTDVSVTSPYHYFYLQIQYDQLFSIKN